MQQKEEVGSGLELFVSFIPTVERGQCILLIIIPLGKLLHY